MRMSHIYQPLLIRSLVDTGGTATVRQLACLFLAQDESQLLFYEKRIKEMPLKVLKRRGVVEHDGELVHLRAPRLTLEQKATIRMLCERKMQEFVRRKGLGLWDYRLLEADPVSDSLRFEVLKSCGGRCALCGVTKDERPLDVDHIIPRSRGGKNTKDNLQALCSKCNRSKRNLDTTDFRQSAKPDALADCPFCSFDFQTRAVAHNGTVVAVEDKFPVSKGHLLVIPRRHANDYFDMTGLERQNADELIRVLRNRLAESDSSVVGFNVGANCGQAAGQTVLHAHIHLIPRRVGDTKSPRGGVRGVIPARMDY